ncbi:hypothetical protein D918_06552 [Trichuris suis]|nr:hypothetical protein D918_06552 [Trichuris suis]
MASAHDPGRSRWPVHPGKVTYCASVYKVIAGTKLIQSRDLVTEAVQIPSGLTTLPDGTDLQDGGVFPLGFVRPLKASDNEVSPVIDDKAYDEIWHYCRLLSTNDIVVDLAVLSETAPARRRFDSYSL